MGHGVAYLDSSAYVKLALGEDHWEALRTELARWGGTVSSALLSVEAVRACARYGPEYAAQAEAGLRRVALLPIDSAVLASAARLAPLALRSLDAIHLATALSLGVDLGVLIAYDARLLDAARQQGVVVVEPRLTRPR
jgi:predicted nucleic acid-binding protein